MSVSIIIINRKKHQKATFQLLIPSRCHFQDWSTIYIFLPFVFILICPYILKLGYSSEVCVSGTINTILFFPFIRTELHKWSTYLTVLLRMERGWWMERGWGFNLLFKMKKYSIIIFSLRTRKDKNISWVGKGRLTNAFLLYTYQPNIANAVIIVCSV